MLEKKYCNGAALYTQNTLPVSINNLNAYNNDRTAVGIINGKYVINNSQITNNKGLRENYSGGIHVYGTDPANMPELEINNTTITNNEAVRYGGGLSIIDNENVFTALKVDNQSKIYDNKAGLAGDDVLYSRQNKSKNETENTISLCNIGSAGIEGIDGWYNDGSDGHVLYAIYEKIKMDEIVPSPLTNDNINTYIIMLIISVSLLSICLFIKRKNINL